MSKTTVRLLALGAVLVLAGCIREPFPPPYYTAPVAAPLQPYLGPPLLAAPAPARVVKKRYVKKRHRRVCRCTTVR
jgi:hypothetical protein